MPPGSSSKAGLQGEVPKIAGLTTLQEIKEAILAGADVASVPPETGIAPIHHLPLAKRGTFAEYDEVLRLFRERGADFSVRNVPGMTLFDLAYGDDFRAALIRNGVRLNEPQALLYQSAIGNNFKTVEALLGRKMIPAKGLDRVFANVCRVYNHKGEQDFPALQVLVDAGADPNARRILDDVAEGNPHLVLALIGLGADSGGGWHYQRQRRSSPLHGIIHMNREVFDALIAHGADVNWRGHRGYTAMMELMRGFVDEHGRYPQYSEQCYVERFRWLVGAGARCLIRDDFGEGVWDTDRGKTPVFRPLIERAIRDENWERRKHFVRLKRAVCPDGGSAKRVKPTGGGDELIMHIVCCCPGVFRTIVGFI